MHGVACRQGVGRSRTHGVGCIDMQLLWVPFPRYASQDPTLPANYNWTIVEECVRAWYFNPTGQVEMFVRFVPIPRNTRVTNPSILALFPGMFYDIPSGLGALPRQPLSTPALRNASGRFRCICWCLPGNRASPEQRVGQWLSPWGPRFHREHCVQPTAGFNFQRCP